MKLIFLFTMKQFIFKYLLTLIVENLTYDFFSKNFNEYKNIEYMLSMINEKK